MGMNGEEVEYISLHLVSRDDSKTFNSAPPLLLILDLYSDLDEDEDYAWNLTRNFRLGRGMDRPLRSYTGEGGALVLEVAESRTPFFSTHLRLCQV